MQVYKNPANYSEAVILDGCNYILDGIGQLSGSNDTNHRIAYKSTNNLCVQIDWYKGLPYILLFQVFKKNGWFLSVDVPIYRLNEKKMKTLGINV